jgi:hypothetical protein
MVQQTKIKYFRVLLYTRSQAESRYNFGNGQGLAKGKEKGKGNTRIWRVEKRKKFNSQNSGRYKPIPLKRISPSRFRVG